MVQLKKIAWFFTIVLLLISCSEDFFDKAIDIDVNEHTSKLAGTALLGANNESDLVLVSFSQGPFEKTIENQILKDATVTLTGNNSTIDFQSNAQNDFFVANTNANLNFIPNNEYTLTIAASNYETITATQTYPEEVPILEATITENTLKIKINDNPNQKNYYLLGLERVEGNETSGVYVVPFGSLTKESGFCYNCVSFNDDTFNGEQDFEIVVGHDSYDFMSEATYRVILYHITEDFYRYDTTLRISNYAEDNPFVEPVILHRNFENGYGVFALVNKTELIFNN